MGFYTLIHAAPLDFPLVRRYFTGHPVEYMETALFAVGLATLVVKMFDTAAQRIGLSKSLLGETLEGTQSVEECDALLDHLDRLPPRRHNEYYVARLRAALKHVRWCGAAGLDDELKYLSDLDASRMHAGYGLFRVIVWAIPILGFLGTVIGITMMLGGTTDLANGSNNSAAMFEIFHGLSLKFDTTALALAFSILLMFVHFSVERSENRLLEQVDQQVQDDLAGRFAVVPTSGEGQLAGVRHLAELTLRTTETLMARQAELWRASVEAAAVQWTQMAESAAEHVREAMTGSVGNIREAMTASAGVLRETVAAAAGN